MGEPVLLESRDARGVVTLTLNRPGAFNALSRELLEALQAALDRLQGDAQARVLVLAANGRAFCAGHDLREMDAAPDEASCQRLFAQCGRMMMSLQKLPIPVVARVHGLATAAGCQLVVQCDLALASTDASFATSGVNYGLFCATPSVPLTRNVPAKQAMELLLTGDFIDAAQAAERGLVNRAVAPEALDEAIGRLLESLLAKPRLALAMGKELFYRQRELGTEAAYQLAAQTMAANMQDAHAREGIRAFTEKRRPSWSRAASPGAAHD